MPYPGALCLCYKCVCSMSYTTDGPFGPGSLTEAIRAAVDTLKPEERLHRRDVLKLDERFIVKRGVVPDEAGASKRLTKAERDAFVFRHTVA